MTAIPVQSNGPTAPIKVQRPVRVLVIASHVVQYASPLFQLLSADPRMEILVAYCTLQGAERGWDPEFGIEVQWDQPLLEGYQWKYLPNRSLRPGIGRFFGLLNPSLWRQIRSGDFDAVVIYTGYMYASFWIAVAAAKSRRIPVLLSSDSTGLRTKDGSKWKSWLKPFILRRVYRTCDVLLASSPAITNFAVSLGMPPERIVQVQSDMYKEEWQSRAAKFDRREIRKSWNIPENAPVVLFCGKLQAWKRPLDLITAFASAQVSGAYLVIAGEGPLRGEVERAVAALGIQELVKLLGFVNSTHLPGCYVASDLLVLPSRYDGSPLVVPEAMFTGIPVILSDTIVGRAAMIRPGKSGYLFRCGDTEELARLLRKTLSDPEHLSALKAGVVEQMQSCTAEIFAGSWFLAIETALARK